MYEDLLNLKGETESTMRGFKLSEITNTLKIKDIKQKLQENQERTIIFNSTATEQINKDEQENSPSVSKQFENIAKELLKPTYASSYKQKPAVTSL